MTSYNKDVLPYFIFAAMFLPGIVFLIIEMVTVEVRFWNILFLILCLVGIWYNTRTAFKKLEKLYL